MDRRPPLTTANPGEFAAHTVFFIDFACMHRFRLGKAAQLLGVSPDTVMAQVEIQAGPHRVVSLISAEAVEALGLEPGVPAVASIKSTNVVIERST